MEGRVLFPVDADDGLSKKPPIRRVLLLPDEDESSRGEVLETASLLLEDDVAGRGSATAAARGAKKPRARLPGPCAGGATRGTIAGPVCGENNTSADIPCGIDALTVWRTCRMDCAKSFILSSNIDFSASFSVASAFRCAAEPLTFFQLGTFPATASAEQIPLWPPASHAAC